jgi:7-cyano-7-deazaguanine reductase
MTEPHLEEAPLSDGVHACRQLLVVLSTAIAPLAAVSTLVLALDNGLALTLSYVADRHVLTRDGFSAYAKARTAAMPWDTPLESLAALMADDLANELVPKWLRVTLVQDAQGAPRHTVVVEDRQPGWDHPTLLNNL